MYTRCMRNIFRISRISHRVRRNLLYCILAGIQEYWATVSSIFSFSNLLTERGKLNRYSNPQNFLIFASFFHNSPLWYRYTGKGGERREETNLLRNVSSQGWNITRNVKKVKCLFRFMFGDEKWVCDMDAI